MQKAIHSLFFRHAKYIYIKWNVTLCIYSFDVSLCRFWKQHPLRRQDSICFLVWMKLSLENAIYYCLAPKKLYSNKMTVATKVWVKIVICLKNEKDMPCISYGILNINLFWRFSEPQVATSLITILIQSSTYWATLDIPHFLSWLCHDIQVCPFCMANNHEIYLKRFTQFLPLLGSRTLHNLVFAQFQALRFL